MTDKNAVCADLATRICDAKDDHASFDYKGVTVEKMQSSLNFGDEWTNEAKRADSEMLVEIIFTLLTLADDMQGEEAETMNETAQNKLLKSLEEPIKQIATNAGVDGSIVIHELLKNESTTRPSLLTN